MFQSYPQSVAVIFGKADTIAWHIIIC
jgi:hypothetical protein